MQNVVVRVIEERPVYRHGLARALEEAGYSVARPEETNGRSAGATVITVRAPEDLGLVAAAAADASVVAILADPEPERYAEVLSAGACAAVAEDASLSDVVEAVEAALVRRTLLPTDVAQQLARESRRTCPCPLTAEEAGWLRKLARGVPVASLAKDACHSERDMYRVLGRLYARIGVNGRAEAIVAATRWGLVE